MLNKKSLAIALMGLGLAGSCFAAANSVEVTFTANVVAATCPFTVTGTSESAVKFVDVPWHLTTFPEKTMTFKLDCSSGVPFNSVSINATGLENGKKVSSGKGAYFAFYNSDGEKEAWDSTDETKAITFARTSDNAASETFTATKLVRFEMTNTTEVGDGHTASVTYTATYK